MKAKFYFIIIFSFQFYLVHSQNILKITDISGVEELVSKEEFVHTLMKNNQEKINKEYLDYYIDLYINYKLQVLEASALGIDQEPEFIAELQMYSKQLANSYLQDKSFQEKLIYEAFERMQYDINASHILFKLDTDDDTLSQYNKAVMVKSMIESKKISFDNAVRMYSESQYNNGNLGYFSCFDLLYDFETVAYNTKVGEISEVVRTKFGYHIIKVNDKRKAVGEIQVAHIMLKLPPTPSPTQTNKIKLKIDEIYQKLNEGSSFTDLADKFSEDRSTAVNGGVIPGWIGVFSSAKEFEEASFSIENIGDYSEPFLTEKGWHIVKLLDRKDIGSFEEERAFIERNIEKSPRSDLSEISFLNNLKKEYNFRKHIYHDYRLNTIKKDLDLEMIKIGNISENEMSRSSIDKRHLFALNDTWYSQNDFKDFILDNQGEGLTFEEIYNRFIDFKCLEYKESKLLQENDGYRMLLEEFRDGIMKFEIMNRNVWSKSMSDTVGLNEFYSNNKDNYYTDYMVSASIYYLEDPSKLYLLKPLVWRKSRGIIANEDIISTMNKNSQLNLRIEEGDFARGKNSILDQVNWDIGITETKLDDGSLVLIDITDINDSRLQKLEDIKGKVISDYQNYLEKKWVDSLRLKYAVEVDSEILYSIIK